MNSPEAVAPLQRRCGLRQEDLWRAPIGARDFPAGLDPERLWRRCDTALRAEFHRLARSGAQGC